MKARERQEPLLRRGWADMPHPAPHPSSDTDYPNLNRGSDDLRDLDDGPAETENNRARRASDWPSRRAPITSRIDLTTGATYEQRSRSRRAGAGAGVQTAGSSSTRRVTSGASSTTRSVPPPLPTMEEQEHRRQHGRSARAGAIRDYLAQERNEISPEPPAGRREPGFRIHDNVRGARAAGRSSAVFHLLG